MKRKLNDPDVYSRGEVTATTASLSFASHSLSSSQQLQQPPTQESQCQVAFCEQTAREMTELVNYWKTVQSAQKERSPLPSAPMGNSLFAWSDDEDDSSLSIDSCVQRKLFPEDEEEDIEKYEGNELTPPNRDMTSDSYERNSEESSLETTKSPLVRNLQHAFSAASPPLTPTSRDETSSLPSEIHIDPNEEALCCSESPDWSDRKTNKAVVQNMHVVSQQQSMQVDQLTRRTAELEQQVHDTLMNSPLFQKYNRRSPFRKQRQEVLRAIDVALDQSSSPIVSSSPRCWQERFDLWLRYGWHRFEDKLLLGLWEWIPLEWLFLYYYMWARLSAHTRWALLLAMCLMLMILKNTLPFGSTTSSSNLVHFSRECISVTNFPGEHAPILQDWLL